MVFALCVTQWTVLWVLLVHIALIHWALVTILCVHSILGAAFVEFARPVRFYGGSQGV